MTRVAFGASILALTALACTIATAQDPCAPSPGERVLKVQLQNAPNQMEPMDEPTRIRVDDRSKVRLCLVNLSPIDVCSLSGRSPAPTSETSPLESITATIRGLGGFALAAIAPTESALTNSRAMTQSEFRAVLPPVRTPTSLLDNAEYQLFLAAATEFHDRALELLGLQRTLQGNLTSAAKTLSDYLAADYRGANWSSFRPLSAPALDDVRRLAGLPLPDGSPSPEWVPLGKAAEAQSILDQMAKWSGDLNGSPPTLPADTDRLRKANEILATAKGAMAIIVDNNTSLKTAQTALKTSYDGVVKVYTDFRRRVDQAVVRYAAASLVQNFPLGTDRKATVTGVLSCVSDADPTKATTDAINYSVLYQDVPHLTASAGVLTTFLHKTLVGTATSNSPATVPGAVANGTTATGNICTATPCETVFTVTDSAHAQVFPMVFLNYRVLPYKSVFWGKGQENELVLTANLSGGFGINPNSGTNQPEFFVGTALGFGRLMIHPGAHYGRTQSLGGGFLLNAPVPTGFSGNPPIEWTYHWKFSVGFSVRAAPF